MIAVAVRLGRLLLFGNWHKEGYLVDELHVMRNTVNLPSSEVEAIRLVLAS